MLYGVSATWHAPVSFQMLNVFVPCKSRRWVGWAAPTDISPHLLRGTGWQSRDVAVLVPARALSCLIRTSVPCSSPQLQNQRRFVHVIWQGRSLMLSDIVTSALDVAPFNKHDSNISEFALVLSLGPTAGVFDKCTNIIERCTMSQVNTCHAVPTTSLSGKPSYLRYTCQISGWSL